MKPKRALSSYILMMAIVGLVIIGALFLYQIIVALTKSQITPKQQTSIDPLDGVVSTDAANELSQRRVFTQTDFNRIVLNSISQPEKSPATVSAQVQQNKLPQAATASGSISGVLR